MKGLKADMEMARELGVAVELGLIGGDKFLTGLHDWNDEEGWFSVYVSLTLSQRVPKTIMLDQVATHMVTDISYNYPT